MVRKSRDGFYGWAAGGWLMGRWTVELEGITLSCSSQEAVEWLGASVSWVDGHVAEGIPPSRCERGDHETPWCVGIVG